MEEEQTVAPEILLERIKRWQRDPVFHPLTCGTDSRHALLNGKIENGKMELYCPDCDYTQENIPKLFLSDEFDRLYIEQAQLIRLIGSPENKLAE